MPDEGFTLVEVVVALGLFALVSLAGIGLVETTLGAERRTATRLDRLADADRTFAVVARDLGALRGPMAGDGEAVVFARRGGDAVAYRMSGGRLVRAAGGRVATLLDDAAGTRWSFLGVRGWQRRWTDAVPPRAVAVVLPLGDRRTAGRVIELPPP